jgi:hypothetical protein
MPTDNLFNTKMVTGFLEVIEKINYFWRPCLELQYCSLPPKKKKNYYLPE